MADLMAGWLSSVSTMSMIFGGCCSNVFALEAIVKDEPDSGFLITFSQFLIATLATLPTQLGAVSSSVSASKTHSFPGLVSPRVPLSRWVLLAGMFFGCNMLNNWAFAFGISVPIHIILRSFGSVSTMIAGYIRGKRYSSLQVASVVLLTFGVIVSAWADAKSKGKLDSASGHGASIFGPGLAILLVAQVLAAFMGIFVQETISEFGCDWRENMFYTNMLSLPLFIPMIGVLRRQYAQIAGGEFSTKPGGFGDLATRVLSTIDTAGLSRGELYLAVNAATQLVCITGVNILASRSSAVTVTIVLNVRKLVSFVISTLLFGHVLSLETQIGAAIVFGSGALYGYESSWRIPRQKAREAAERKKPDVPRHDGKTK